ncbi:hypothetical protein Nepgr_013031 [Nepenthes gracilis]|uniref:HTH myb-type domain-containing protein n=1 Tax=Nepenthes gracilis TaxID=150966 RepID=A0AAD3XP01_NEPGR|nr:hypothetical protein Nepgr_013031 [Nepenthes gracilis]
MGDEVMAAYYGDGDVGGSGGGDKDRVLEWEVGLPGADDLTPLSQELIPPRLASAFNIEPQPRRTIVEVNCASQNTLSSLRDQAPTCGQSSFKSFKQDHSPGDIIVDKNDEHMSDSKKLRRMDETDSELRTESPNSVDELSARTPKRSRIEWTPLLHKRFIDVVAHLGIKNAVPKTIMQLMNVEGLTRENVASHLQKYRLYLKRMQGPSSESHSSSDQLFATTPVPQNLYEGGSSGDRNGHGPMPIPVPYAPPMTTMLSRGYHGNGHGGYLGMPMCSHGMGNYNGFKSHDHHPCSTMQQRE